GEPPPAGGRARRPGPVAAGPSRCRAEGGCRIAEKSARSGSRPGSRAEAAAPSTTIPSQQLARTVPSRPRDGAARGSGPAWGTGAVAVSTGCIPGPRVDEGVDEVDGDA